MLIVNGQIKINAVSPNSSHGTYDFFENEVMNKEDIKAEKMLIQMLSFLL